VSFVKFTVQEATGIRRADLVRPWLPDPQPQLGARSACTSCAPPPPQSLQQLYLDDKVMIDPLSLADFPALGAGKANVITVRSTAEADKDGEAAAGAGHK